MVTVVTTAESAETFLALAAGHVLGAETEEMDGGGVRVHVFLDGSFDAPATREVLAIASRFGAPTRDRLADGRWVERYQEGLRPIRVGERFTVLPTGEGQPHHGTAPIRLTPGRAFGTGEHATTRLCAALLERFVAPGSAWLDLGCGSGVLAVIASRLGAGRVVAVDIDPEAVDVARETLAANELCDVVALWTGDLASTDPERFDGIVANVSETLFVASAEELRDRVRPGGWLLASGFLECDRCDVERALSRAGWIVAERLVEPPWGAAALRSPER